MKSTKTSNFAEAVATQKNTVTIVFPEATAASVDHEFRSFSVSAKYRFIQLSVTGVIKTSIKISPVVFSTTEISTCEKVSDILPLLLTTKDRLVKLSISGSTKICLDNAVKHIEEEHRSLAATSKSVKNAEKIKSATDAIIEVSKLEKSFGCPIYLQPKLSNALVEPKRWSMKEVKLLYNWKYFIKAMQISLDDKIKQIEQSTPYNCKIAPAYALTNTQRRQETSNLLQMANFEYMQFLEATKQRNLLFCELHEDFKSLRRLMVTADPKFEEVLKLLFEVDTGPYYSVELKNL